MVSIRNRQGGDIEFTKHSTVKWLLMPLEATDFFRLKPGEQVERRRMNRHEELNRDWRQVGQMGENGKQLVSSQHERGKIAKN